MVKIKDNVIAVLQRIHLTEIAEKGTASQYFEIIDQLNKLDTSCITKYAKSVQYAPLCWKREKYTQVIVFKKFIFAFRKINLNGETLVVVDEVAEQKGNGYDIVAESIIKSSKKILYESIMRDVSRIVKMHLKRL